MAGLLLRKLIVISTLLVVTTAQAVRRNEYCRTVEKTRTCFTLYGSQSPPNNLRYTWGNAQTACVAFGGRLARIANADVQSKMQDLMGMIALEGGMRHVWLGGRISNDTAWRYTDGEPAADPGLSENCAYINLQRGAGQLRSLRCGAIAGNLAHALCYHSGSVCNPGEVSHNGRCYRIIHRSGGLDWNAARQECRSQVSGGELTFVNAADGGLMYKLSQNLGNEDSSIEYGVWVGLTRRKWVWIEGSEERPMIYTKFRGGVSDASYVYFDAGDFGKWDAKQSAADISYYFLCEKIEYLTTPTTPTTTTTTASTTTTTTKATTTPTTPATTKPTTASSPQTKSPTPSTKPTSDTKPTNPSNSQTTHSTLTTISNGPAGSSSTTATTTITALPAKTTGPILKYEHIVIMAVIGGVVLLVVIIVVAVIVSRGRRKHEDINNEDIYVYADDASTLGKGDRTQTTEIDQYNPSTFSKDPVMNGTEGVLFSDGIANKGISWEDEVVGVKGQDDPEAAYGDGFNMNRLSDKSDLSTVREES